MDSSGDELDDLEAMKWSKIGGATMETHDEPDKEKLENGIKETLEFVEALQDLNMKDKLGGASVGRKSSGAGQKRTQKKK